MSQSITCPNCGFAIQPPPLSTSTSTLVTLYLKTILLPPFGIIWGIKYLKQSDDKSKIVGALAIVTTIIELIWIVQSSITAYNTLMQQVQLQLNGL